MYPQDIFAAVSSTSPRDVSFVVVVFLVTSPAMCFLSLIITEVCMIPTNTPALVFSKFSLLLWPNTGPITDPGHYTGPLTV